MPAEMSFYDRVTMGNSYLVINIQFLEIKDFRQFTVAFVSI
jgi:hypothetical protein